MSFLGVGLIAVTGHWVLYAHLASHYQQIEELTRRKRSLEAIADGTAATCSRNGLTRALP